jgi:NADPH-dependent glutamate synthase beta subunit-like oxidoreductase
MGREEKKVPSIWTTGWTDILRTGTWRNAIAVHQKRPAPCHGACPVGGQIPVWVQQLRNGNVQEAWRTLVEHNPIPASIGRTCHHPCEGGCNRKEHDGAVSVNALEQYVGDLAIEEGWELPAPTAELDRKVAVIGGGPAGLSCAYQLRRKGFQVTLYDANPEVGGVLRYGVPEYRLPKKVLAAEAGRIVDLGIEVVAGRRITAADLEELETRYAAVFIAFGAHQPKHLPQFPGGDGRVIDALAYLKSIRLGSPLLLGRKVVVIGGGSVAMDVAGSALRQGSEVRVLALETRETMPAPTEEIEDVLEEGAVLMDGAMAKSVADTGSAMKLHCVKVNLDPQAPAGTIRPLEVSGTNFAFDADTVILAVGQDPELADWETRVAIDRSMVVVDGNFMTSRPGIFAAGDVAGSERFVSTAVGDGKKAANHIAQYLGRQVTAVTDPADGELPEPQEVAIADINTFYFPPLPKGERGKADPKDRKADFREIRLGLEAEQAQAQTERCFSCGNCVECDNCFYFCPDMAVVKDESSPTHYRVLDQYCKGCGCCLEECPRGAMGVKEETK